MASSIKLQGIPDKTAHNQDFYMHIGESKVITITLTNLDASIYDPSGMEMEWWMAKTSHSAKLLQKEIGTGIAVAANVVSVTLDSADTYDLKPELYYHELKVYNPDQSGLVSVATVGTAQLRPALDMREVVNPLHARS